MTQDLNTNPIENVKNDVLMNREMNMLKEEKFSSITTIKREQEKFAQLLKGSLGDKMIKEIRPKSKIIQFFKKLGKIYG